MLEHSAMYLNVTPPYEEDASFFPDFYTTRLGPCELQDPVWAKMSALTGIKQKRKKADNKPQTQINKCNNEKLRREKENYYIDELANLISDNFSDMSSLSVKPDKCAILQETVNQIRKIKQQETANQTSVDPVQQGEVSSSRPSILSNDVFGPLLLEVLEGFLFVVNCEGKVEYVTDNVANYIKYTKDEITGKSIYNFLHHGDHTKFHSNLLPMTIVDWGNDQPTPTRSKSLDVRFLLKLPDDLDETVEEKRQRVNSYELMHISSTHLREQLSVSEEGSSDGGPCLLCIASRISHRDKASCSIEQFTTKLDANGKIICVDTSSVSETVSQVLRKDFKGRVLRDFVPSQDVHKLNAHLRETLTTGTSISAVYRIQVSPDNFVKVQTKSKLFKTNPHATSDTDFIMATHSIISGNESLGPGDPGGGGIGGPLMTSVVNGAGPVTRNGPSSGGDPTPPSTSSVSGAILSSVSNCSDYTPQYLDPDFNIDFPSSTWTDLDTGWSDRPDSRQSETPVSTPTPRPPSNPSYSNAPTVVQSPMAHFSTQQPSPANQSQQQSQSSSSFNTFGLMDSFPEQNCYPVEEQKDTKANVIEEAASLADSHRLRILLTNPPTSSANSSSSSQQDENRDRILKELLNQQDDDQGNRLDNRTSPRRLLNRTSIGVPLEVPKASASSTGNNMLRQLLNDKSDDDDIEAKTGMKKSSELLQQLLKKGTEDDEDKKNDNGPQEDTLLRSLGFPPGSPGERRGSKRSNEDKDDRDSKRSNDGSQVTSSASSPSDLCKRNKMLAFLLAKQTPTPPSIPPIPQSVISATPQDGLSKVYTGTSKMGTNSISPNTGRASNTNRHMGRSQPNFPNNVQRRATQHPGLFANQATSTSDNNWIDTNHQTDPDLSELLDEMIDIVPDYLDVNKTQPPNPLNPLSERAAIHQIENSLRQIEDAVNSPTTPNISLPARPPAYTTNVSQGNIGYPPPTYHQNKYRSMNVRANVAAPYTTSNPHQFTQQRRLQQQQQQQEKERLLLQQKQQQMVIPSNVPAAEINSIQNIGNLLNNAVAPNVSLQRSNSLPEAQLSPTFNQQLQNSNTLSQQNQRGVSTQPPQQQPFSPHAQLPSPLGQQSFQPQTTAGNYVQQPARLSPQYNAQLSPRQGYPQGNGASAANWSQQRITVQQNPMLNAQLMASLTGGRTFQRPSGPAQQQQGALNNSGVSGTRHSPYGGDQFPTPTSPNNSFSPNQYLQRLQRTNSVPTTSTTQITGGLNTRQFPGNQAPPLYPSNIPSIPQSTSMMYPQQQDAQYNCYDQQQPGLGYERRGSAPSHLQPGVANSNPTSEFVRQELRAVVGARTAQAQPGTARSGPTPSQQIQQMGQSLEIDGLGMGFDIPSGASDSPKLWGAMGSEIGSMSPQPATSRTSMEEGRPGDTKTSLLQQLLSEQSK